MTNEMTSNTTQHTHIQTRNTTGQVCQFRRDIIGWLWADTGNRISTHFLTILTDRIAQKSGGSVVFYTPSARPR